MSDDERELIPTKWPGYFKYEDKGGEWRWIQRDDNNRQIAESGEGYKTQYGVDSAIENVVTEAQEAAVAGDGSE